MKANFFTNISRRLRAPFNRWSALHKLKKYHAAPRSLAETVDWAMHFGGHGFYKIGTIQIREEILALAERVAALKPKRILEIGTARGGTVLIWAAIASEHVISCDLFHREPQRELLEKLPPTGSKCRVTLLTGNSHSAEFRKQVENSLNGELVDFLFIDGDHTVEGVAQDYRDYKDFVRPGGLIAFHDIVESQPLATNQVFHFWKSLRDSAETEEIVADRNQTGFGIGVLRTPLKPAVASA